jgi:hypothetical protein
MLYRNFIFIFLLSMSVYSQHCNWGDFFVENYSKGKPMNVEGGWAICPAGVQRLATPFMGDYHYFYSSRDSSGSRVDSRFLEFGWSKDGSEFVAKTSQDEEVHYQKNGKYWKIVNYLRGEIKEKYDSLIWVGSNNVDKLNSVLKAGGTEIAKMSVIANDLVISYPNGEDEIVDFRLPAEMDFCFAAQNKILMIWRKDGKNVSAPEFIKNTKFGWLGDDQRYCCDKPAQVLMLYQTAGHAGLFR